LKDITNEILKKGLRGHNSHVSPLKAITGLDAEIARKRPSKKAHSIWDILHHIVLWQDKTLEAIRGGDVDWTEAHAMEWPSGESLVKDSEWEILRERFDKGLTIAELLDTTDLSVILPAWSDENAAKAFMVLVQHNSYHIGQIVVLREILGVWPPKEI
jgi:uncharacterized damage-inducible protein DinB